MTASTPGASANPGASPDAVGRGVLGHDPEGELVLFVLAGHSLGSTPVGADAAPTWLDLRRLLNLDAVGEPVDSRIAIEATFDGGMTLEALWPEPFCDQVTDRLRELLDTGMMIPEGADPADEPARADAGAGPAAATESFPASTTEPGLWSHDDERPLPGEGPPLSRSDGPGGTGELTLEDVVYHGGYPGENKRRKRCVAVMDSSALAVSGPHGPEFRIPWEEITSVEAQNSDEAKFRLGVKAKRDSTVVVFECNGDTSLVLEAHDVPTLPLKAALHELLDGTSVDVA
ncbi:MAG: hypothetical protein M9942_11240 [Microthrixaceae bacterium]|nr:hypothetical protein [Microthrixaceae bacterium]MCO5319000.1 hypothetical protein [Microthrixaceae bacterium]